MKCTDFCRLKTSHNVNSYYAENKLKDKTAKIELDFSRSTNIITDDGKLKVSVSVPPDSTVLIRNIAPADESQGWSCSCECNGELL